MNKMKVLFIILFFCFEYSICTQTTNNNDPIQVVQDINVYEYRPFSLDSKVVTLQEESTLKLTDDLPLLDGATALYPVYSSFVRAVYPEKPPNGYDYDVPAANSGIRGPLIRCTQTPMAFDNLINGKVDIIFCAEPSREQIAMAAEKGLEFNMTPIGKDAFVFFVNKSNPINNISSSQIRNIYSGNITNWQDIGGQDEEIIPYQRPKNSGSQTILETIMGGISIMEPLKENVVGGMGGIIEQVAIYKNYQGAIGFSFLFFTTEMARNNEIKILSIDNIPPTKETIRTNEYPFSGTFFAITMGNENGNTKKIIEWILSEQGQYLIEKTGYVPLR
jgi:phosphate transport system substrate-binding protein